MSYLSLTSVVYSDLRKTSNGIFSVPEICIIWQYGTNTVANTKYGKLNSNLYCFATAILSGLSDPESTSIGLFLRI